MKKNLKIKKQALENIAFAAQKTFPMEFIALLGSKKNNGVADELVILPAVFGEQHALLYSGNLPFDRKILGSVHSHPSPNNSPSQADLDSFRKLGNMHLIISYPFSLSDIAAFDNSGKKVQIKVLE